MISDFIHDKLVDWRKWLNSNSGVALCMGFPSRDIIQRVRDGASRAIGLKPPVNNPDAERMDLLICRLPRAQRRAIIYRYYYRKSDRAAAEQLRITHQTMNANVHDGANNLEKMWRMGICDQVEQKAGEK